MKVCRILLYFFFLTTNSSLFGVCHKCEIIREKNKHLPPPKYEFYEDYLKSMKNEEDKTLNIKFSEDHVSSKSKEESEDSDQEKKND
jgi:hypothetical protein